MGLSVQDLGCKVEGSGLRVSFRVEGFRGTTPKMENEMDKTMEDGMVTGFMYKLIGIMLNDDCTVAHIMLVLFEMPFTMIIQGISDHMIAGNLRLCSWCTCKVYRC